MQICQVAMCTSDVPGSLRLYSEEGAAAPGGVRPRFYDLVPAVVDQGFLHVAVGSRDAAAVAEAFARAEADGREHDAGFGAAPQPRFLRRTSWPQPSVGPPTP